MALVAETVTIEGRPYLKRNPLGVLGLSFITIGIYFFYWYWKINDELSTFEHDDSISPTRASPAASVAAAESDIRFAFAPSLAWRSAALCASRTR